MTTENEKEGYRDRIHHWVFPVEKKVTKKDTNHNNGYEWVDLGNGKSVRVPKKTEKLIEKVQS